ncbi:hypothetical protein F5141DRAFT_1067375 [Pisolithus sp. B1]|nr:hypothetical protein F5141DRAFT_1067375 [Pisolithus sp. B1]
MCTTHYTVAAFPNSPRHPTYHNTRRFSTGQVWQPPPNNEYLPHEESRLDDTLLNVANGDCLNTRRREGKQAEGSCTCDWVVGHLPGLGIWVEWPQIPTYAEKDGNSHQCDGAKTWLRFSTRESEDGSGIVASSSMNLLHLSWDPVARLGQKRQVVKKRFLTPKWTEGTAPYHNVIHLIWMNSEQELMVSLDIRGVNMSYPDRAVHGASLARRNGSPYRIRPKPPSHKVLPIQARGIVSYWFWALTDHMSGHSEPSNVEGLNCLWSHCHNKSCGDLGGLQQDLIHAFNILTD